MGPCLPLAAANLQSLVRCPMGVITHRVTIKPLSSAPAFSVCPSSLIGHKNNRLTSLPFCNSSPGRNILFVESGLKSIHK